jgi:hypothetical protein
MDVIKIQTRIEISNGIVFGMYLSANDNNGLLMKRSRKNSNKIPDRPIKNTARFVFSITTIRNLYNISILFDHRE